jgi:UDP-glucose 4-epimerase
MLRVVVTGATGFVGKRLLSTMADRFDLVPVSRRPCEGITRVATYADTPEGDLLIHLAEENSRKMANATEEDYHLKSSAIVKILSKRFSGRIIYASSSLVYANTGVSPFYVGNEVCAQDPYCRTKLLCENAVLGDGGTVVRLSNLFGIGMSQSNVMSDILRQIPGHGPIRVRDDKSVCDFLAVDDAIKAFCLIADSDIRGILNVGSGIGTSINALAKIALKLAGEKHREITPTQPSDQPQVNILDVEVTKRILGWSPSHSLSEHMNEYFFTKKVFNV